MMTTDKSVTEVIVFCSGKGGTGKTSLISALGYALRHSGHSVLMIDADRATDGFSLFLLGPEGTKQMDSFAPESTFVGLLNQFAQTSTMTPQPHTVHRMAAGDHQLSYEVIISGKGLYGDMDAEAGGAFAEPWNLQYDRSMFQNGVRALFDAVRLSGNYDYVLVDSRGGFSFESTDVAAAADSFVVVTESSMTNFYQDRNLVNRINDAATRMGVQSLLRGIIVNKSTEFPEVSFRNELVREFGIRLDDTFPVHLDVEAAAAYKTQKAIYISAPASPFAYDSVQAFKQILRVVTSQWAEDRVLRWNQLVATIDAAIAAHNAKVDDQRRQEDEKVAAFKALTVEHEQLIAKAQSLQEAAEKEKRRQDILLDELKSRDVRRDEQFAREREEAKARFSEDRARQDRLIEQLEAQRREADKTIAKLREEVRNQEFQAMSSARDLVETRHRTEVDTRLVASELRVKLLFVTTLVGILVAVAVGAVGFWAGRSLARPSGGTEQTSPPPVAAVVTPSREVSSDMTGQSASPAVEPTPSPTAGVTDVADQPLNLPSPRPWFKQCLKGTKNVIVASGLHDEKGASQSLSVMRKQIPGFEFVIAHTVAADGASNPQYAILAGHGLSVAGATELVKQLKGAGTLPYNVYTTTQTRDATCVSDDQNPQVPLR